MNKILLTICFLVSTSIFSSNIFAETSELNTYHHNQVQQIAAQVYQIYEPNNNTRVRQLPDLNSKVIGLLNNNDRNFDKDLQWRNYKYTPVNDKWIKVEDFKGILIGYSYKSLFKPKEIYHFKDSITTPNGTYKLDFAGFPYVEYTYPEGRYCYNLTLDDKQVFEAGWCHNFKNYTQSMSIVKGQTKATVFHHLLINNNKIGWLFGWNSYGDSSYFPDMDFSFARIFLPSKDMPNNLYTDYLHGIKFGTISENLDKQPNQLLIVPTGRVSVWGDNANADYYFLPGEVTTITSSNQGLTITSSDFKIDEKFIATQPEYAYAIAVITNDYDSILKAYSKVEDSLVGIEESCGRFNITVEELCPECRIYEPKEHLHKLGYVPYIDYTDYYNPAPGNNYEDAYFCLRKAKLKADTDTMFHPTGLFPTRKVVENYVKNKYTYFED